MLNEYMQALRPKHNGIYLADNSNSIFLHDNCISFQIAQIFDSDTGYVLSGTYS